ncbi:FecCD family ABC transporter permease [Fusibacter sp. JL216-2]|uniref:FecCD family ABC transporter permease n=1 Tax=Fusibacter sp. JL216-2 TaxID=3071453 RepID=UPI003D340619
MALNSRKIFGMSVGLLCILIFGMAVAATFGPAEVSVKNVVDIVQTHLSGGPIETLDKSMDLIVWKIRMPRILLAVIIGMALAGSGVVFQAVFQNPMADPYVLGISSGAAFGAACVIVTGLVITVPFFSTITIGAFAGAMTSSLVVWQISKVGGKTQVMTLLLSGIALNFLLSSAISMLMVFNREQVERIVFWTMGSVATASWTKVGLMLVPVLLGLVIFMIFARDLNIMLMGEDVAESLGVNVEKLRVILLLVASAVTASAVSMSGVIGFVGLIVPHAVRLFVGPDHRKLIPLSVLTGGIFLLVADTIARTMFAPSEIPIGVMTAFIGAPYFIFLLQNSKGKLAGR